MTKTNAITNLTDTPPKSPKLNRSVTVLGVFRIPSIRDLSEYWRGPGGPKPEGTEPTEKKRKKKNRKDRDPNEESGSSSDDYEFKPPTFGRSTSEMTHTMHERREEMRRRMAEENALLEAAKSAPASPASSKTRKQNKVGVMFADTHPDKDLDRPPSKRLSESPQISSGSEPTTLSISQSPPRHSPLRSSPKSSPPKSISFVVPSLAPTPTPSSQSPKLVTVAKKRQDDEKRARRISITRSASFRSGLGGKAVVKQTESGSEESSESSESDDESEEKGGSGFIARSKSTTAFKHVGTQKKKNSKSNLLSQDTTTIDYMSVLPELIWLRVAVLLAPIDLLKLRALSKKFTKYVNTNLVWASFSWRDFGNITVSSKNWREHYAQAFIRSKHPITLEIKGSKTNIHLNDRLFITSSLHNRSHKAVNLAVGTSDSNFFETGALLRAGKGQFTNSATSSNTRAISNQETTFITIAPNETQSFLCRVVVTEHNDCVGLMADDGSRNFLPLSTNNTDIAIWYEFSANGCLPKNCTVREDTIYWKGTVCSNKFLINLDVMPKT